MEGKSQRTKDQITSPFAPKFELYNYSSPNGHADMVCAERYCPCSTHPLEDLQTAPRRDWGFRLVQLHMSRSPPTFPRGAFRRRRVRSRRGDGCGAGFHVCAGGRSSVCVFSNDCGVPMTRRRGVSPLKGQCRLQKGLKRFCHPEGPEE